MPIHVLTHTVDPADEPPGSAKFYTDVDACADQAREAAGDRAVLVHGAGAAQASPAVGDVTHLRYRIVTKED
ncbi:hypothetical protein ABZ942_18965 [Nocardia sp. NPDC046473]|uniref:hypothetical protein n=1 Tax=Nocardia sp. NPDC046473 TaxID=3155733 RepID=UPI0033C5EB03